MDKLRNPTTNLSTWIWGPILWSLLHTLAFFCDNVNDPTFKASSVEAFFKYLQPLLPCEHCRESYAAYLVEVQEERKESIFQAFTDRHLMALVVDLHNKVNTKLAKIRWKQVLGVLHLKMSDAAFDELIQDEKLDDKIALLIDTRPPLQIVRNRFELYQRDYFNVEGVLLLLLVFSLRLQLEQGWNFALVLATVSKLLALMVDDQAKLAGKGLEKISQSLHDMMKKETFQLSMLVDEMYRILFVYCKSSQSYEAFRTETDNRLQLMIAKSCGQGSCR